MTKDWSRKVIRKMVRCLVNSEEMITFASGDEPLKQAGGSESSALTIRISRQNTEISWGEPLLLNKLDVDEVELVQPVPSTKATSDTASVNAPVNAPVKLKMSQGQVADI